MSKTPKGNWGLNQWLNPTPPTRDTIWRIVGQHPPIFWTLKKILIQFSLDQNFGGPNFFAPNFFGLLMSHPEERGIHSHLKQAS